VEVRALTTGRVRQKRAERGVRRYLSGDWAASTFPVFAFLVEHSDGLCLFDTGQTARAAEPGWFPAWYPYFRLARFELGPADEAAAQVARLGHDPADVRLIVLSHLHTDHVGGLDAFAGADVIVSRREWERATGVGGRLRGYLPQRWPKEVHPRLVDLDGPPLGPFPATHDLLGDGRLVLVPTPGHTPSHMAMLVQDDSRTLLLAGDVADTALELPAVAPELAEWCSAEHVVVLTAHDDLAPSLLGAASLRS
jgi:glyoxylase-like metal-dependent hydrolase (beta-lactamase superfamily II)